MDDELGGPAATRLDQLAGAVAHGIELTTALSARLDQVGADIAWLTGQLTAAPGASLPVDLIALPGRFDDIASNLSEIRVTLGWLATVSDRTAHLEQLLTAVTEEVALQVTPSDSGRRWDEVTGRLAGITTELERLAPATGDLEHLSAALGTVEQSLSQLAASTGTLPGRVAEAVAGGERAATDAIREQVAAVEARVGAELDRQMRGVQQLLDVFREAVARDAGTARDALRDELSGVQSGLARVGIDLGEVVRRVIDESHASLVDEVRSSLASIDLPAPAAPDVTPVLSELADVRAQLDDVLVGVTAHIDRLAGALPSGRQPDVVPALDALRRDVTQALDALRAETNIAAAAVAAGSQGTAVAERMWSDATRVLEAFSAEAKRAIDVASAGIGQAVESAQAAARAGANVEEVIRTELVGVRHGLRSAIAALPPPVTAPPVEVDVDGLGASLRESVGAATRELRAALDGMDGVLGDRMAAIDRTLAGRLEAIASTAADRDAGLAAAAAELRGSLAGLVADQDRHQQAIAGALEALSSRLKRLEELAEAPTAPPPEAVDTFIRRVGDAAGAAAQGLADTVASLPPRLDALAPAIQEVLVAAVDERLEALPGRIRTTVEELLGAPLRDAALVPDRLALLEQSVRTVPAEVAASLRDLPEEVRSALAASLGAATEGLGDRIAVDLAHRFVVEVGPAIAHLPDELTEVVKGLPDYVAVQVADAVADLPSRVAASVDAAVHGLPSRVTLGVVDALSSGLPSAAGPDDLVDRLASRVQGLVGDVLETGRDALESATQSLTASAASLAPPSATRTQVDTSQVVAAVSEALTVAADDLAHTVRAALDDRAPRSDGAELIERAADEAAGRVSAAVESAVSRAVTQLVDEATLRTTVDSAVREAAAPLVDATGSAAAAARAAADAAERAADRALDAAPAPTGEELGDARRAGPDLGAALVSAVAATLDDFGARVDQDLDAMAERLEALGNVLEQVAGAVADLASRRRGSSPDALSLLREVAAEASGAVRADNRSRRARPSGPLDPAED